MRPVDDGLTQIAGRDRPALMVLDGAGGEPIGRVLEAAAVFGVATIVVVPVWAVEVEVDLIRGGARAVVAADVRRSTFLRLAGEILTGRSIISCEGVALLASAAASQRLTTRQATLLGHLADGLTYPEIAERMFVSTSTVKTHAARLAERLGVRGQAALARRARELRRAGALSTPRPE